MSASTRALLTTREAKRGRIGNSSSYTNKSNVPPVVNSPLDQISFLQRTVGNRGVERLLKSGMIQFELKVNEPGDMYEQEADRIAGQVMATPAHNGLNGAASIQRATGPSASETATAPASVEQALATSGQPFEPGLRREMEQHFGWDFSRVRVHTGAAAERSAREVNARAYTVGSSMVFAAGEFNPSTLGGRRLLAHELTHVVQQSGAAANVVRRSNGFDEDEPTRVWPRAKTVEEPIPAGAERGGARGHVERGGQIYPGEEVSGEINTGGSRGPTSRGGGGGTSAGGRRSGGGGGGGAASKLEGTAEHAAGKSGTATTKSAAKTTGTATGAGTKAFVKAEETAIKAETKLGSRLAKGAGRLGLSMLLPGPEDAIMLMADFAGSYLEAWEIIEQRNTRSGIAMGIAAGMMGLGWDWVQQNVWRRFVTRDVATQVVGAVGKAERSYNDGLVRGYKYGAAHPQGMKNRILGEAFTVLFQEGYRTDEEGLFSLDTVARVAAVLTPLADDFLQQAAKRREAREKREEEERRKQAKEWGSVGFKV
jgi:Domain of unknown function (DUF4157)